MEETTANASGAWNGQAVEVLLREYDFVSSLIHLYRQFQMQAVGFAMILYAAILGLLGAAVTSDRFGAILLYSAALVPVPIALLILAFGVMEIRIRRASQYIDLHIRPCMNELLRDVPLLGGRTFLAWERSPGASLTKYQRGMASSAVFVAAMAVPSAGAGLWYAFWVTTPGPVSREMAIGGTVILIGAVIHTAWLSFSHESRVFKSTE